MAKEYQKYRRSYDSKIYKQLFSLLPKGTLSILDIGCGTGKSTEPLLLKAPSRHISVFGLDPDISMLREAKISAARKKLAIKYLQGTAEKLPFVKRKFDAVITGAAFHWFGDNKRALKNIKNVLKPNGMFFIFWALYTRINHPTIGAKLYEKYNWKGFPEKFRKQFYVRKLLSGAGFKRIKTIKISFTEKNTISHAIGVLKTNSSYALMSPKDKAGFVREMTQAYKKALGKRKYITDNLETLICYGFK